MSELPIKNIAFLIDSKAEVAGLKGTVFLWNDYASQSDNAMSIPAIVENEFVVLRKTYLNWTAKLADAKYNGRTVRQFLTSDVLNGESYWWQTLIADKCPYKTKTPFDIIRLRAFEMKFLEGEFDELHYIGNDKVLAGVLKKWIVQELLLTFQWKKTNSISPKRLPLYRRLPKVAQASLFFLHILWSRLRFLRPVLPEEKALCTIVTYFPGIDRERAEQGVFRSNYWGPLHEFIETNRIAVNWIWIYGNLQQFSFRESVDFQERLNRNVLSGRHLLLENFLTLKGLASAVKMYLTLLIKSSRIASIRKDFHFEGSSLNFFNLLKEEWFESFRGYTAFQNCIYDVAFREAGKKLPTGTKLVTYIWENQPWEHALLATKKYLKNATYVGSVHTPGNSAMYNLKIFPGDEHELNQPFGRLCPDVIGAPGEIPATILRNGGWPPGKVRTLEALRYIESLAGQKVDCRTGNDSRHGKTLLVVTGSIESECCFQISLLEEAEKKGGLRFFSKMIVKPHPSIPVNDMMSEKSFQIPYTIVNTKLPELWPDTDMVYTSNSTSVSLEAAYLGFPVIITGATDNLNINPLFGTGYANFIHTADELASELLKEHNEVKRIDYFFSLDHGLPAWKSLFADAGLLSQSN